MHISQTQAFRKMADGDMLRFADEPAGGIAVFSGRVWITQEGDPRDLVVEAGESFMPDRPGVTIVGSLGEASILVFDRHQYQTVTRRSCDKSGDQCVIRDTIGSEPEWRRPIDSLLDIELAARRARSRAFGRLVKQALAWFSKLPVRSGQSAEQPWPADRTLARPDPV